MSVRFNPDNLERRMVTAARVDLGDDRKIRGTAIVFHSKSVDLGGFREIIMPDAVDRTLSEALDVRALVDHDTGKVIGRTTAGTLALKKDRAGLKVVIDPPNTSAARDIMALVERGDVTGMSFGFRVLTDDWRMDDGVHIREVRDMEIFEVSVVSFPAYQATEVSLASVEAFREYRTQLSKRETDRRLRMAR